MVKCLGLNLELVCTLLFHNDICKPWCDYFLMFSLRTENNVNKTDVLVSLAAIMRSWLSLHIHSPFDKTVKFILCSGPALKQGILIISVALYPLWDFTCTLGKLLSSNFRMLIVLLSLSSIHKSSLSLNSSSFLKSIEIYLTQLTFCSYPVALQW